MRITGVGIEIDVALNPDEIGLLRNADLIDKARIWDSNENLRSMPFVVSTHVEPRMEHAIRMNGCYYETEGFRYLPHARRVSFHIGDDMYSELQRRGFCVSRFTSGGKIKLFDASRKSEVYM